VRLVTRAEDPTRDRDGTCENVEEKTGSKGAGSNAAKRQTLRGRWCVAISEILVRAVRRCIKYVHEFSEGMLGPFPWAVAMARADSTLRQLLIDYTRCPNYAIWWERECAC
jgi:hypothetical protein